MGVGITVGGDSVGDGVVVGGTGVGVGGTGVEVGRGVTVGGGVGVSVSVGGMVAVGMVAVAAPEEGLLIGVEVWMATGRRVGRFVGVGSFDVLSRANHRVTPEPRTTKVVPRQSPVNTIAPRAKISLYCFLFNLLT